MKIKDENSNKQVVIKEAAEIVAVDFDMDLLGELPKADANDYKIPALVLIQPTSKVAGNAGEIVDGGSGMVLTTVNKKLEFIPLWSWKTWKKTFVSDKGDRKSLGSEQFSPQNAHYRTDREVQVEGGIERREECTNIFLMLAKDLGGTMPMLYVMRFKGMAQPEAKKLLTFSTNAINFKQLPFSYVYSLTPHLITNDKGKFYVPVIQNEVDGQEFKQIKGKDLQVVADWVKVIIKNKNAMTGQMEAKLDEVEDTGFSSTKAGDQARPVSESTIPF